MVGTVVALGGHEGNATTMLRIDVIERDNRAVLLLEGRLVGAWVGEVRRSCGEALGRAAAVTLDLTAVSFVDAAGIVLLRELASREITLANATPFVAEQLGEQP